jgi:hypothetical protein
MMQALQVVASLLILSLALGESAEATSSLKELREDTPGWVIAQTTPTAKPTPPEIQPPEFGLGDRGPLVKQLQHYLTTQGYYQGDLSGEFDEATQASVTQFQQDHGLEATGIADAQTWKQLQTVENLDAIEEGTKPAATSSSPAAAPSPSPTAQASPKTAASPAPAKPQQGSPSQKPFLLLMGLGAILGLLGLAGIVLWFLRLPKSGDGVDLDALDQEFSGLPDESIPEPIPGTNLTPIVPPSVPPETRLEVSNLEASKQDHLPEGQEVPQSQIVPAPYIGSVVYNPPPPNYSLPLVDRSEAPAFDRVKVLIQELQNPDATQRHQAIWELGQCADSRAVRPLVNLIMDSDSKQHSLILSALSEIGMNTLKPMQRALALSLQDESPEVRKNAIRDLLWIYDLVIQTSQLLNYATEDDDGEVRETAAWALDQLKGMRRLTGSESDL